MVGPEHFGIVGIDCAKPRCIKWMLCDFYGNVLIPPTIVALNRNDIQAAVALRPLLFGPAISQAPGIALLAKIHCGVVTLVLIGGPRRRATYD